MKYVKTSSEIKKMEIAGQVLAQLKIILKKNIFPGMNLLTLDKIAYNFIKKNLCEPSFLNYQGFPKTICISLNSVLIHGIPKDYKLKKGDMVSIDLGCSYKNYHADTAFTVVCGTKPNKIQYKIINATYKALNNAISCAKAGANIKEISGVIEKTIKNENFFIPKNYCGHGIGSSLHEDPIIHNIEKLSPDFVLKKNMVIAIEPMLIYNTNKTFVLKDGWSVDSKGNNLSCHAEHTILIQENGCKILTE